MRNERLVKMARVLVNYSLEIEEGQKVLITGSPIAEPLLKEVYREAIRNGAHPETRLIMEGADEILLKEGSEQQIEYVSPIMELVAENYQALLSVKSEYNTRHLTNIDPNRLKKSRKAQNRLFQTIMQRASQGELKWCGTQYPTHATAQEAQMSLAEYTEFVFTACLLNEDNPQESWQKIHAEQARLIDYLNDVSCLHILSQDTDLKMNIKNRKWINCDGKNNFPDGEIFTGPVEDSVEGHIRFSYPGIYMGREIQDIQLEFKSGKVVKAQAAKGEKLLKTLLDTDKGSCYVGEIAVGTNYGIKSFTRNMLFDEKIGGTVHLALGNGYPESGSKNQSAIHWDLLCDMSQGGEIYADGELIYKEGNFTL